MNIRRLWLIAATVVVAVIGGTGAAFWLGDDDGTAHAVELRNNGRLVGMVPEQEALSAVSETVGFEVRPMRNLPAGFVLAGVDSNSGPPGLPNALAIAVLIYTSEETMDGERTTIRVEQTGIRTSEPDDRAERIDLGVAGAEAFFQETAAAHGYWVFTAERGFLVGVLGPKPERSALLPALRSLAE